MKAILLRAPGGLENLKQTNLEDPGSPKQGQIRVRLHASSLNYHDYNVATIPGSATDGRIPLSDGAGVVEEVGEGVAEFKPGDCVVSCFSPAWQLGRPPVRDFSSVPGDGVDGYARDVVVSAANSFTQAPRSYTHAEAATLTTAGLTAWRALVVEGRIQAGDTVLVPGTGGVSIFALQFAKRMGATVIITSSSDEKLKRATALGADHTINYKACPEWGRRVLDLTGGRGADHVIELGGPGTLTQSIEAVRLGGLIALIGVHTGWGGHVPTVQLMAKQARLQGIIVGSRMQQIEMIRGIDATGLKPVIDRHFGLEELADAFRYQAQGSHFGKIGIQI
ncbi:zinc-dependent alcohol dehydrogenase family protein [Paraburkholderia heleia]|uniref:zinc-dependent alcohol dehydrogenase family protein n=1 Tax=Paraburkholderia heleia TaxID=634127 RepID=UPI0005AA335D|nr:NAD(P)-dependent alcohol dehydrogenase [Paraburkholderia heleia]